MNITKSDHRRVNKPKKSRPVAAQADAQGGTQHTLSRLARATLRGSLVSLLAGMLLSLLAAAIAYATADPDALTMPLALGALGLAALAGGFVNYRNQKSMPLLCGALNGLLLLLLFFFVSCFFSDSLRGQWTPGIRWGLRGGVMLFSLLGAVMGSYAPKKKKRRKR